MRLLTWRIPNVALACPVDVAEERCVAPSKRSVRIDVPPVVTLGGLLWLSDSRWRIEMVSETEAIAHEV